MEEYSQEKNVLTSDVSLLKNEDESIYLFGVHSTMILFSMGLLELCNKGKDIEITLEENIKKAKQLFVYTTAIAEEGGKYKRDDRGKKDRKEDLTITRDPRRGIDPKDDSNHDEFDSYIRILYPHRITQFVDFGKVFAATCQAILILNNYKNDEDKEKNVVQYEEYYKKITKLLKNLQRNVINPELTDNNLYQPRFNGHFTLHFDTIKKYFDLLWQKRQDFTKLSLLQIRDKIVKDIFKIMQGNPDVIP